MRARTTWNREQIKQASANKQAEDPRAMNQDHHSQQPKADAYVNGDPSSWAEDIHKPNTWDVEYSGGQTKRDEIGMPEKRPETYTHSEKSANMDEKFLTKKADLTVKLAKLMLGNTAPETAVEDQAVALMHMPDDALITTYNTISEKLGNQSQFPGGQFPTAEQQQMQAQQQVDQFKQQAATALEAGDFEQAKQALEQCMAQQQGQQQQVMAGQRKADQAPMGSPPAAPPVQAPAQPAAQVTSTPPSAAPVTQAELQQAVTAAVTAALKGHRANDQQQGQQDKEQKQTQANQQMPPGQQAPMQQQAEQVQQQMQAEQQVQQQMLSDDALLDELMGGVPGQGQMSESDIELDPSPMDVGEVQLGPEDDVLKTLFSNEETQDAEQAQQAQQGQEKQAGMGRTASTRTVGTRPSQGVSRVGGGVSAPAGRSGGGEIDKLAALWPSAPDVRSAFNMGS